MSTFDGDISNCRITIHRTVHTSFYFPSPEVNLWDLLVLRMYVVSPTKFRYYRNPSRLPRSGKKQHGYDQCSANIGCQAIGLWCLFGCMDDSKSRITISVRTPDICGKYYIKKGICTADTEWKWRISPWIIVLTIPKYLPCFYKSRVPPGLQAI